MVDMLLFVGGVLVETNERRRCSSRGVTMVEGLAGRSSS
jgi:hypothetical protein